MNNLKEYTEKSKTELEKMLKQQREVLRDLRFKDSNRQLKNMRALRKAKKDIARILTVLNEKKNKKITKKPTKVNKSE